VHTSAAVSAIREHDDAVEVCTVDGETISANWVLAACAPSILDSLTGRPSRPTEGSQLKVNLVLRRLPRLRTGVDPPTAFAGTLHLEESYPQLLAAYATADAGSLPEPLPAEVYCHSLTDASILAPELVDRGYHTFTLFGLHTPARLFANDPRAARDHAVSAALSSLQAHLAEPLDDVLAEDTHGKPCVEAASPLDLERILRMPGGNIFHGDLEWPWLDDDERADTPAERRGVVVAGYRRVFLAGAGSRRGGGVSGLGGLHAARAVLES
jgi:phytoene dehydrogenase-like protein